MAAAQETSIALVISDVDGTLVTTDKRITAGARAAVRRLAEAGIAFTIASSRPPAGLTPLIEALDLVQPIGAFNGATIIDPGGTVLAETLIPAQVARDAAAGMRDAGLDVWVFTREAWTITDRAAPYVDFERQTLQAEPAVQADLAPLLARASKIVGVSPDHARLAAYEQDLAARLGAGAQVHRSQPYYLDVTPAGADKGSFVDWMADRLGLDRARIATFGDAGNDRAMFARSGLSVAMGNADPAVQVAAIRVSADNDSEGFAEGVMRWVLPRP